MPDVQPTRTSPTRILPRHKCKWIIPNLKLAKMWFDGFDKNLGTLVQCWSLNLWKSVRYLSEICQKNVSYKNVSENSHKCVRILSENCQMQICVRNLSEKIWKYIRNVLDFINVSVLHLENCLKSVRNITFDTFMTHLSSFVDILGVLYWWFGPLLQR